MGLTGHPTTSRPRIDKAPLVIDFDVISSVKPSLIEDDDATTRLPAELGWLEAPDQLQGYRLGRKLSCLSGVGVYRGEDPATGAPVVLKWLPRTYADYGRAVGPLYTEAQLTQRLEHAGLAPLLHADEDELGCVLVYGRPAGAVSLHALAARLRGRVQALPVGLAADLVARVARAVGYVTGLRDRAGSPLGVTVGRLSPAVVLVGGAGEVQLDTPALRLGPDTSGVAAAGLEDADVPYVAPECLVGATWSPAAAVYSLGVILYELLVGRPVYGDGELDPAGRALAEGPDIEALSAEAVPDGIVDWVARAVASEPERRISRPEAFAEGLEIWLATQRPSFGAEVLGRFLDEQQLAVASVTAAPAGPSAFAEVARYGVRLMGYRPGSVAEAPIDDDEATVRGSSGDLAELGLVERAAVAADPSEGGDRTTKRGHVIPAWLLSPTPGVILLSRPKTEATTGVGLAPEVVLRMTAAAEVTAVAPPPAAPIEVAHTQRIDVEAALPTTPATRPPSVMPARRRPWLASAALGVGVLCLGVALGLAWGELVDGPRPGLVVLAED